MPALFDMPRKDLEVYIGRNPRPDDFDEFWERSLDEMRSVQSNIEIAPARFTAPTAECFDLCFTGVRGARIHAKYLRPTQVPSPHPAVILFHGYDWYSGNWTSKLPYVSLGYSVVALDCRGQAGLSQDVGGVDGDTILGHLVRGVDGPAENLLYRHLFLDAAQVAGIVMSLPEVDPTRVAVSGESQGGGLSLACAALEPRIKLAAPVYPYLCDYRRAWEMDLTKEAYGDLFRYFKIADPLHEREDEFFTKLGYIDVQFLCPRIRAEVFMGTGLMDMICPPSTQYAAYNKIRSLKRIAVYPEYGHENLYEHADRIFDFFRTRL